jgi:hypothetical protein
MPPKFTVTMTPVDNFGGRSHVRFGVGEHIELDVKETPPVKPATAVEWVVKSGPAKVKAGQMTGSALVACGNKGGAVVLELRDKKDPKTVYATKRFEVVAPSGVTFKHKQYQVKRGLGFKGYSYIEPFDVSFKWVETREGAAPYEGKGYFAQAEVSLADLADDYSVIHPVKGAWTANHGGAKKNMEASEDDVMTSVGKNWSAGTFTWNIPWLYRVKGLPGDFRFTTAVHKAVINASGQMTLSKFNVKLTGQLPSSS